MLFSSSRLPFSDTRMESGNAVGTARWMFGLFVIMIHETRCWKKPVNFVPSTETKKKKKKIDLRICFLCTVTEYKLRMIYIQRNRLHPKSRKMSQEINNKATDSTNRQQQHEKLKAFYSAHTIYIYISPTPWSVVHVHVSSSTSTSLMLHRANSLCPSGTNLHLFDLLL